MANKLIPTEGKITIGSKTLKVIYDDNPTSQSLIKQMPFTVELKDYAGIEKIFYPKKALSGKGAPKGADPEKGDIMYYEPWGDVAIFYKDFGYADGLIKLGRIEGDVDFLKESENIEAKFEVMAK